MLEGGLSTGESVRLQFAPYKRIIPSTGDGAEGEAENTQGEATLDASQVTEGSSTNRTDPASESSGATSVRENVDVQRHWFNLVCYGLPNLVITQVAWTG